jgi:hypothetical protein
VDDVGGSVRGEAHVHADANPQGNGYADIDAARECHTNPDIVDAAATTLTFFVIRYSLFVSGYGERDRLS